MQNFETLFRRAWERGREFKLSVYILLNWLLLTALAVGIVAAATGGLVLRAVGDSQPAMLLMAGIYLVVAAVCVRFIKKK